MLKLTENKTYWSQLLDLRNKKKKSQTLSGITASFVIIYYY